MTGLRLRDLPQVSCSQLPKSDLAFVLTLSVVVRLPVRSIVVVLDTASPDVNMMFGPDAAKFPNAREHLLRCLETLACTAAKDELFAFFSRQETEKGVVWSIECKALPPDELEGELCVLVSHVYAVPEDRLNDTRVDAA